MQQKQRGQALLPVNGNQGAVLFQTSVKKAQIQPRTEAGRISGGLAETGRQVVQQFPANPFGFRILPPLYIVPMKRRDTDGETAYREQAPEAFACGGDRGEGKGRAGEETVIESRIRRIRKAGNRIRINLPGRGSVLRPSQIRSPRFCGGRTHRLGRLGFRKGTGSVFSFHARHPPASEKHRGNG